MRAGIKMVGAKGFEPSTSWSRTRRASQAALRPERPAPDRVGPSRSYSLTHPAAPAERRSAPGKSVRENETAGNLRSPRSVFRTKWSASLALLPQCELHHARVGQQPVIITERA